MTFPKCCSYGVYGLFISAMNNRHYCKYWILVASCESYISVIAKQCRVAMSSLETFSFVIANLVVNPSSVAMTKKMIADCSSYWDAALFTGLSQLQVLVTRSIEKAWVFLTWLFTTALYCNILSMHSHGIGIIQFLFWIIHCNGTSTNTESYQAYKTSQLEDIAPMDCWVTCVAYPTVIASWMPSASRNLVKMLISVKIDTRIHLGQLWWQNNLAVL